MLFCFLPDRSFYFNPELRACIPFRGGHQALCLPKGFGYLRRVPRFWPRLYLLIPCWLPWFFVNWLVDRAGLLVLFVEKVVVPECSFFLHCFGGFVPICDSALATGDSCLSALSKQRQLLFVFKSPLTCCLNSCLYFYSFL
jgi:hypothetical protein